MAAVWHVVCVHVLVWCAGGLQVLSMDRNYDCLVKVLLCGDSGVGKTCLISQFTDGQVRKTHITTIGGHNLSTPPLSLCPFSHTAYCTCVYVYTCHVCVYVAVCIWMQGKHWKFHVSPDMYVYIMQVC